MNNIVTNMKTPKEFWENFPIEVILDELERKKQEQEDHREHLQIPLPPPSYDIENEPSREEEDSVIIIKFA